MTDALPVLAGLAGLAAGPPIDLLARWYLRSEASYLRYALVAAGTAALYAILAVRLGPSPALPAYLYLGGIAVVLALIDAGVHRLPNAIVLTSYLVGALLLVPPLIGRGEGGASVRALLGMAALSTVYLVLALVSGGSLGYGDVKLAGLLGLYLGFLGWPTVWLGTLAGFLLAGLAAGALLAVGRASRDSAIAFGPYMLAGALLAILLSGVPAR
jgi:leader peptidase (prepilin peptidase)/N-methyltransferase